jgi:hypothetical protein
MKNTLTACFKYLALTTLPLRFSQRRPVEPHFARPHYGPLPHPLPSALAEIVQYSTLTRAALQSTKTIAESLTQFKKAPDAPALPELRDQSIAS